jgi:hypothetical protein
MVSKRRLAAFRRHVVTGVVHASSLWEDKLSPIRTDNMSSRCSVGSIGGTGEEGVLATPVL